jgi:hypothetical protein
MFLINTSLMKYIVTLGLVCIGCLCHAQRFTIGLLSGTAFTDYHGGYTTGAWETKTGSLSGIYLAYSLTPVLSVGTEIDMASQSYQYKPYDYNPVITYPYQQPCPSCYSFIIQANRWQRHDVDFFRLPLMVTLSTPTRLRFSFSAGLYIAYTLHHEYSGSGVTYPYYMDSVYPYEDPDVPKWDNGMVYTASLSYPVADHWRIYATGRYFIGHKSFFPYPGGRTGANELAFGVGYNGLFKSKRSVSPRIARADSSVTRVFLTPFVGISISHMSDLQYHNGLRKNENMTAGIRLEYRPGNSFSVIGGLIFKRMGYSMHDSSNLYYRHAKSAGSTNDVNTRTHIDYLVIPILAQVHGARPFGFYLEGGPYIGLLLNARVTGKAAYEYAYSGSFIHNDVTVDDDIEGNVRSSDFGWVIGGGLRFPLPGHCQLSLGLDYYIGTVKIFSSSADDQSVPSNEDKIMYNRSLNITAGLNIPIHKNER